MTPFSVMRNSQLGMPELTPSTTSLNGDAFSGSHREVDVSPGSRVSSDVGFEDDDGSALSVSL